MKIDPFKTRTTGDPINGVKFDRVDESVIDNLTPDQFDGLVDHTRNMGFQDAIDLLRATGQESAAGFLESAKGE